MSIKEIKADKHSIYSGDEALDQLSEFLKTKSYSSYFIIVDSNTLNACLPTLVHKCNALSKAEIIEIDTGENEKTLDTCIVLWQVLTELGCDKKSLIINLGGGVITDMGGFVASTFKRGIDFINIPTTLLAMVDASVGGKTGIDFDGIKNHIGTHALPLGVFICPEFLNTLSTRQLKNGMAEVYKIALTNSASLWNKLRKITKDTDASNYSRFIYEAVKLKNTVVKKDPLEINERRLLNFGHTIGHAVESSLLNTKQELLHGEAIIIGIIIEVELSLQLKHLSPIAAKEITNTLLAVYKPSSLSLEAIKKAIGFIKHDKKNEQQQTRFTLLSSIGNGITGVPVDYKTIEKAFEYYTNLVK